MKKYLILAAFAAVALGACTKVETTKETVDEPLTFGVYAGNAATKATYGDITTANLQSSTDGFGVFASYTEDNNWATDTYTPNFMYNQQVRHLSSFTTNPTDYSAAKYPSSWYYTPLKYWPNGQNSTEYTAAATSADKITFFAYAPHYATFGSEGVTAITANNVTTDPSVTFVVPAKSSEQVDLLYATPIKDATKQALSGRVAFTFKHALAKLNYQVQAVVDATAPNTSNLAAETTILLESLTITANGAKKGTLNLNTGNWTPASPAENSVITYSVANSSFLTTTTVNSKTGFNVTETATALNASDSPMIIPATIAANGLTVTANYWVLTEDSALVGGYSTVQNVITAKNADAITFDKGKQYTIVVRLGLNSVDFNVTEVETWGTADGTPVDLPQNAS